MKKTYLFAIIIMACLGTNALAQTNKQTSKLGSISWVENKGFLVNGTCATYSIDDGSTTKQCGQIAKLLTRSTTPDTKLFTESLTKMDTTDQEVKAFKTWGKTLCVLSKSPAKISGREFNEFRTQSENYFKVTRVNTYMAEMWQISCILYLLSEQPLNGDLNEKILVTSINTCNCENDLK